MTIEQIRLFWGDMVAEISAGAMDDILRVARDLVQEGHGAVHKEGERLSHYVDLAVRGEISLQALGFLTAQSAIILRGIAREMAADAEAEARAAVNGIAIKLAGLALQVILV